MSNEVIDYMHLGMRCPIRDCVGDIKSKNRVFYCTKCGISFYGVEFIEKENGE